MGLDIKIPIGLMFSLLGLILTILGLVTASDEELYLQSLGINVNLWTGIAMLIIGIVLLSFSKLNFFRKKLKESIEE